MKQCPKCYAENPLEAKFCRKCGSKFSISDRYMQKIKSFVRKYFTKDLSTNKEMFTLDTFQNISFQPVSVVKIQFINRFVVFLCILFVCMWFSTITGLTGDILYILNDGFYYDVYINHKYVAELCLLGVSSLFALVIIKCWIKKMRYKFNADYIEDRFVNSDIVRIARKSRMGLFDKSKKKVRLSSNYSNIEKFDDQHLSISRGSKKGLYSLAFHRIIIPVKYDFISPFTNSITSATIQGTEHHYDVKGNKLR